jgi:hypothetical protein
VGWLVQVTGATYLNIPFSGFSVRRGQDDFFFDGIDFVFFSQQVNHLFPLPALKFIASGISNPDPIGLFPDKRF